MMILSTGNYNKAKQFDVINIQWAITRKCNFCCSFCGVHDNNTRNLSLEQNMNIVDKLIQLMPDKQKTYVLIGGEPTLYPQYELLLYKLSNLKKEKDVICLFSNGSEDNENFQKNVNNGLYQNVVPLFTYHSHMVYNHSLEKKLNILIDNNITFKVNMMILNDNIEKIKTFYKKFEKYHNEKFIFECVPIEQIDIKDYNISNDLAKTINSKNKIESFMDIYYELYDKNTKQIYYEKYTQSELKLLSKEYFCFLGFRCYSKYRLSIDFDGNIYDFCERCLSNNPKSLGSILNTDINMLNSMIHVPKICRYKRCLICDTSLLYKEKLNRQKYLKGVI